MENIGSFEAKTKLSALLDAVLHGKEFLITRHGKPVARLVPAYNSDHNTASTVFDKINKIREKVASKGAILKKNESWKDLAHEGHKY